MVLYITRFPQKIQLYLNNGWMQLGRQIPNISYCQYAGDMYAPYISVKVHINNQIGEMVGCSS